MEMDQHLSNERINKLKQVVQSLQQEKVQMLAQIKGLQVVRNHKIMLNSLIKYFGQEIYQPRDVKIGAIQDPLSIPVAIKVFLQIREMQSWATNCDRNARLCWAMIHGGYGELWVSNSTTSDSSDFIKTSLDDANSQKNTSFRDWDKCAVFIRFIMSNDPTNGHSLVLYKNGDTIETIQAYLGVTIAERYSGDQSTVAFQRALVHELIDASVFGIDSGSQDSWAIAQDCYIGIKRIL